MRRQLPTDTEIATGALLIALHSIAPPIARRSLRVAASSGTGSASREHPGAAGPVAELAAWRLDDADAEELGVSRHEVAVELGSTQQAQLQPTDYSDAVAGASDQSQHEPTSPSR